MDKIKNILFLFFAGGNSRPDAFEPAYAGLASCALGNPAVDDGMANLAPACIIGRFDTWLGQKTKIRLFRQLYLLNYKPLIQRLKAFDIFILELILNNFINLLRLKRPA